MREIIARHLLFNMYDFLNKTTVTKLLRFYKKTEWHSTKKIKELQNKRLKKLIEYSYNNVPYYKQLMNKLRIDPKDIRTIEDLKKLPILTKTLISHNTENLVTKLDIKKIKNKTSGSTGYPMRFFYGDYGYSNQLALILRNYEWCNLRLGNKYIMLWGSSLDIKSQEKIYHKIKNYFWGRIYFPAEDMNEDRINKLIITIKKNKIKVLEGYVSALYSLCKYLDKNNMKIDVPILIPAAGTVYNSHRKLFKKILGCEIFERYGSREFISIAHECKSHEGLHINEEGYILEIVDENNKPINKGIGKIIITDLSNYVMPFIRYQIEDLAILSNKKCSCGRNLRLIKKIIGRSQDVIISPDGRYIAGEYFANFFGEDFFIKKYQIVQTKIDELVIKIVLYEYHDKTKLEKSIRDLKAFVGDNMKVSVKIVSDIKYQKNGKFRFIYSKIKSF